MFFSSLLESWYYEVFPGESSEQQQLQLLVVCSTTSTFTTTTIPSSSSTSERFFFGRRSNCIKQKNQPSRGYCRRSPHDKTQPGESGEPREDGRWQVAREKCTRWTRTRNWTWRGKWKFSTRRRGWTSRS